MQKKRKLNVRRMVFDSMLIAVHAVLAVLGSIDAGGMKFTFEGLPIILGGLMFGPVDGLIIGLLGSFVAQLYEYGLGITTILWIFPHGMRGLLVGWYAKRCDYKLNDKQLVFITVLSALLTTTLNTPVIYLDALIFQYDTDVFVPTVLAGRFIAGIIVAVLFAVIIRPLRARLRPYMDRGDK